jgi:mRNA interferase MazF
MIEPKRDPKVSRGIRLNDEEMLRWVERPLVLSHDVFNERSVTIIAVALTSQEPHAGFPLTLESKAAGLKKQSWVKISQIRTLSVDRIGSRLARASEEELARVVGGLNEILG